MKLKHFSIALICLTGCSVQKVNIEDDWVDLFKEYAVYKCACEITDNKLEPLLWSKNDISFSVHREILGNYGDTADSIGRAYARKIEPLAVDKESDLYGSKPLFVSCLKLYKSDYILKEAKLAHQKFVAERGLPLKKPN